MNSKEQFLIELERIFDNSSWDDIINLVDEAIKLNLLNDDVVKSIVEYVKRTNRISFKQWKVLRCNINDCNKKKYKYGNQ